MSSSKVYRHYTMDRDNPVIIEVSAPAFFGGGEDFLADTDFGEGEGDSDLPPEEQVINIIEAARAEAEQIILDAQAAGIAEQAAMRLAAKSEIAVLHEQTKNEAYNEGIAAATREGDKIRAQARAVMADAEAECHAARQALEPEMVDLLTGIAGKLLNNAVAMNPGVVLALVRMGMQNATITGNVTVYVSVEDYDEVIKRKSELLTLTDGSVKLEIVKDMSLGPMDCIIDTPFGSIDASLGQQFEVLKQNITYLLNG
jgi:flagellar assembly protein FliH